MRIGVPRETKEGEARVALVPRDVAILAADGHDVLVQSGAGARIGFGDDAYRSAGARVVSAGEAWQAELVVKVKELQDADFGNVRGPQAIFGFHHLAGEPQRTRRVAAAGVTAIAFEMVRDAGGKFPMLAPMSAIAGRMAIEVGAKHLGREPAKVLVLGAGPGGSSAAAAARERGAEVTVLRRADATPEAIERAALGADIVVGAVFIPGEPTPKLLPRELVARMRRGSVIVDVSIEEGGVAETSRPTTHADPVFVAEGVVHYCVGNMPAAEPAAAADAISAAALPYVRELATKGIARAIREDPGLRAGILLWKGRANHEGIAREAGLAYTPLSDRDLE
ncbi:MAG: alanine dehydrogenase [Usitatibacter sp.]